MLTEKPWGSFLQDKRRTQLASRKFNFDDESSVIERKYMNDNWFSDSLPEIINTDIVKNWLAGYL